MEDLRRHLFYETSHSPALADLVGLDRANEIVDFCFIANPYYPTPAMLQDLKDNLESLIKSYPSSTPAMSQKNLAAVLHVNPDQLIIGNGATELIVLINRELIDRIAVPVPTFGEYIEKLRAPRDAELYSLRAEDRYQLHLPDFLEWTRARGLKSLLVINPGNPTGQLFSREEMTNFLHEARDMELVIVDESFVDFAGDVVPSLLPFADQFPNLLIVRSMSKHCGVPGLRLGFCYSSNLDFLNRMRRFIPTWNVNTLAEYFISQLPLTDTEYREARMRLIGDVRCLYDELCQIPGLDVYPTGANFVLFRIHGDRTATELQAVLLDRFQVYVRDCSNKVGMDNYHVRVASQGREKDERLVDALRTLFR